MVNQKKTYRPLPVGVDSFEKLMEGGYYYVDKTLLIKELLDMKGEVNLFTRPRRFGKTLNMTMLRSFFERPETEAKAERQKQLFAGLAISEAGEQYTAQLGQYPVIFLTLKSGKQNTWELAYSALLDEIEREFDRHSSVLKSDRLSEVERERYLRIWNRRGTQEDYQKSLQFLSVCLEKVYDRKTVILIDEYDVPLENAYFRGFYDEIIGFLRSLFESALKTNESLELAVMTGCLRISKESIFTGLNNLKIISIRNNLYAEHFGFTQAEVDKMLEHYGCTESREEAREWYDGYLFGDVEVYNPWSMINYVEQKYHNPEGFAAPYWSNTSGNAIVRSLIEKADGTVREEIERLIAGGTIEKPVHEDITYGEIDNTMDNLWNFLFFTGYLTKVSERKEGRTIYARMRIPNEEVTFIYETHIRGWFDEKIQGANLNPLYEATLRGDTAAMELEIGKMLMESISYLDGREAFYHGFLAGLYKGMQPYLLESNREEGNGRPDLLLRHPSIRGAAIVFELKAAKEPMLLDKSCGEALEQIERQRYKEGAAARGYQKILAYGISFYGKDCVVKSL